jgi:hypothetical protein
LHEKLLKLFKANKVLLIQYAIDEHIKKGLVKTIISKKKRRQRGKKLNILGEEDYSL